MARPSQVDPVPIKIAASEVTRLIQQHVEQVEQWHQMVNAKDMLKQQLLYSLE